MACKSRNFDSKQFSSPVGQSAKTEKPTEFANIFLDITKETVTPTLTGSTTNSVTKNHLLIPEDVSNSGTSTGHHASYLSNYFNKQSLFPENFTSGGYKTLSKSVDNLKFGNYIGSEVAEQVELLEKIWRQKRHRPLFIRNLMGKNSHWIFWDSKTIKFC